MFIEKSDRSNKMRAKSFLLYRKSRRSQSQEFLRTSEMLTLSTSSLEVDVDDLTRLCVAASTFYVI